MSLAFSPHNVVVFDITEGSAAAPGSAEGTLSVTNVAAPEAAVLLKVKTNAAERYLVHPHILLLAPGETRVITIKVPPSQLAHLKLDVARQSAAGALRRPTAFLMLAWPLGADIAGQLAEELVALPSDKARTVTLNAIWKSHEAAAGSASFESAKFSVQCDAALERRLRIAEFGTDPLDPPSTTVDGAAGAAAARAAAASAAAGASSAKPAGSAVGGGGRGGDQLPGEAANASHAVRPGGPAGDDDAGVGAGAAAAAEEEEEDSSDPAVMAARLLEATEALLALEHERDELVRLLQRRERDNEALKLRAHRATEAAQAAVAAAAAHAGGVGGEDKAVAADGVRRRHGTAAAAAAAAAAGGAPGSSSGEPPEDDDDAGGSGGPAMFPLWQLLLVAAIAFLLGRLSVAAGAAA